MMERDVTSPEDEVRDGQQLVEEKLKDVADTLPEHYWSGTTLYLVWPRAQGKVTRVKCVFDEYALACLPGEPDLQDRLDNFPREAGGRLITRDAPRLQEMYFLELR